VDYINGKSTIMVDIKWTSLKAAEPEQEYLAFAGLTERKSVWTFFSYLMRARKVAGQLNQTNGLIGYTARMEFLGKKLVNLTVWENESDLKDFAHKGQHAVCMEKTKTGLKPTEYVSWRILGSQLPPKIEEAYRRHAEQKKVN
jgi:hypothetical protein